MKDRDKEILGRLYESFSELSEDDSIKAMLTDEEEGVTDRMVLTTLHSGFGSFSNLAEGEFYFDEDIFVSRIIVVKDVPAENRPQLCVLISLVNEQTPVGSFGYDIREDALVYNLRVPFVSGLSGEELVELCDRTMAVALSVSQENAADLVRAAVS